MCIFMCSSITETWKHSLLFEEATKKAAQSSQTRKSSLATRFREAELTARNRRNIRQIEFPFSIIFELSLTENVKPSFAELFVVCLLEYNYVIHTYNVQAYRN